MGELETTPKFLIAMPQLQDSNFLHSVVLLLNYTHIGAFGFVINRPTSIELGQFASSQNVVCHHSLVNIPLFRGGPVEPHRCVILHADHTVVERQSVLPGVYLSSTEETLQTLLQRGSVPLRLVMGYSGWGPGQLDKELAEGAWLIGDPNPSHILQTAPETTWQQVLHELGVDPQRLVPASGIH